MLLIVATALLSSTFATTINCKKQKAKEKGMCNSVSYDCSKIPSNSRSLNYPKSFAIYMRSKQLIICKSPVKVIIWLMNKELENIKIRRTEHSRT